MGFSHVMFDLDGTLLNTLDDLALACNHTCELFGWPTFTIDDYRLKVGNGMPKLIERIMPDEVLGDEKAFQTAMDAFQEYYAQHKEDHTAPYPGIMEMLDGLREAGVTVSVLSNKDDSSVKPLVANYFGEGVFAEVQGRIDEFPAKPAAPITLHVLEKLGADPAETLYVGDSNVDVATGHNAGLKVAGVAWGFRGTAELIAAGTEYIAETPADIVRLATE